MERGIGLLVLDSVACFMSGDTGHYTAEDLLAAGATHVFPKPFSSLKRLALSLADIIARRPS